MNLRRPLAALTLSPVLFLMPALAGCGNSSPATPCHPASSDPQGKTWSRAQSSPRRRGAAANRLYKIVHVDDYPDPIGYEYHFIVYSRRPTSLVEAAKFWRQGTVHVELDHIEVRQLEFMRATTASSRSRRSPRPRWAPYNKARRSYPIPPDPRPAEGSAGARGPGLA